MLAFQAGDEGAFEELVEAYSGPVFSLLTRFLGPVARREDLVQEVFLRVLGARDRYTPTARFSTWIYRIAFNLCANERARRTELRSLSEAFGADDPEAATPEPVDPDAPAPHEALERDDVVHAVRTAIARLPDRQRMALILAKYEGLSHVEIGEVLGVSDRAIKSLVYRARETLRERLAAYLPEEAV